MPILVSCPSCERKLKAKDVLAGRKVKCPRCGSFFVVNGSTQTKSAASQESFTSVRSSNAPAKPPVSDGFDFVEEAVNDAPNLQLPDAGAPPAMSSNVPLGLGIPAILLGAVALLLGLAPYVRSVLANFSVISLSLGGLGLLLGLGGLAVAITRKGQGIGFPIAGASCSLVAVAMAVVWLVRPQPENGATSPVAVSVPLAPAAAHDDAPDQSKTGNQPPEPPANAPRWVDASKNMAALGDLRVSVNMALVSSVKVKGILGEQTDSPSKYLGIQIFVGNASKNKKIDYRGWSGASAGVDLNDALKGLSGEGGGVKNLMSAIGKHTANVTDNFGNTYKRFAVSVGEEIPGQINASTSIYPEKTVEDLLVFEPPLENIEYLHLELPAAACGMTGTLYLQIPKSMIRR